MIEPLLDAVEKYDIKFLTESLTYLVNPKTVISFFPFVVDKVGEEHFLLDKVWRVMDDNFKSIASVTDGLQDFYLLRIWDTSLNGMYIWCQRSCSSILTSCGLIKRSQTMDGNWTTPTEGVMTDIKLIRFPCMSHEEFLAGPCKTEILTPEEKIELMSHMMIPSSNKTSFVTRPRTKKRHQIIRFKT